MFNTVRLGGWWGRTSTRHFKEHGDLILLATTAEQIGEIAKVGIGPLCVFCLDV